MKLSDDGVKFIAGFEGYSGTPYKDVVGKWTIGYGHLIKTGEVFSYLSQDQALDLLRQDAAIAEDCVNDAVTVELYQNEFDALVSFVYNLGCGNFKASSLLRIINSGDFDGASDQFLRWNKAGGKVVPGLTRRRQAEADLFTG